jgi:ADP-dependent NAD(P)H-hydrate dehydratase
VAPDVSSAPKVIEINDALLRRWPLPLPDGDGDKEDRGRVLIIAGSREIPGTAVLAATAALRAGAGKVTIATPASIAQSVAFAVPESRVIALAENEKGGIVPEALAALDELADKTRAVLIGPGLPYDRSTSDVTAAVLARFSKAGTILDAGAMELVRSAQNKAVRFSSAVLMTPHAGEMAHLRGLDKDGVAAGPADAARDAACAWHAFVALKGAVTHIAAPDGRVWQHEGGNIGLATSGSGDVLSGIIAGLAARGAPLEQASAWGVALHARAGSKLAERCGPLGYLARELAAEVPALMAALSN